MENREYQRNLEGLVAERTIQLEQRIKELLALNNLFQDHLRERFEVAEAYRELARGVQGLAQTAGVLAERAQSQTIPDLKDVPGLDSGGQNLQPAGWASQDGGDEA